MNLNAFSDKLIGSPGPGGWSQVFGENGLFVLVSGKSALPSLTGEKIFSSIRENKPAITKDPKGIILKSTLDEIINRSTDYRSNLEITVLLAVNENALCAAYGGGVITLVRKGLTVKLLDSSDKVVSAAGKIQANDLLILSSKTFFYGIDKEILAKASEANNPGEFIKIVAQYFGFKEDSGSLAVVAVSFSRDLIPKYAGLVKFIDYLLKLLPEKEIRVRKMEGEGGNRKKTAVSVGIILLLLLSVSIIFGVKQRNIKLSKSAYQSKLEESQHKIDEASSLIDLDPERARQLFSDARAVISDLRKQKIKDPQLDSLDNKIAGLVGKILGEYHQDPNSFLDLTLLASGFKGDEIAFSDSNIYILDRGGSRLVSIDSETKKTEVLAGPDDIPGAVSVIAFPGRVFVLTGKGIYEINSKVSLSVEKTWSGEVMPKDYLGNIYVLEKQNSQIIKFSQITNTNGSSAFGAGQNWFTGSSGSGSKVDFSNAVSWSIDGSIWILKSNGSIEKYTAGSLDTFALSSINPGLDNPTDLFTDTDFQGIYILDPQNSRVVVFSKDGNLKATYISDKIKEFKKLVVSEKDKKMFLISDTNLYVLDIQHL